MLPGVALEEDDDEDFGWSPGLLLQAGVWSWGLDQGPWAIVRTIPQLSAELGVQQGLETWGSAWSGTCHGILGLELRAET